MKQFTVPQFIDVESKIIGPITVRQFILLIIAALFLFIEYKLSDMALFITLAIPTVMIFGSFAFAKVNGMPFHYFLINIIQTVKKPRIRVWQKSLPAVDLSKQKKDKNQSKSKDIAVPPPQKKLITRSRLSDLSLVVDTGGIYQGPAKPEDFSFNKN